MPKKPHLKALLTVSLAFVGAVLVVAVPATGQISKALSGTGGPVPICTPPELSFLENEVVVTTDINVSYEFHHNDCGLEAVFAGGTVAAIAATLATGPSPQCPCTDVLFPDSDADAAARADLLLGLGNCSFGSRACALSSASGCGGPMGAPPPSATASASFDFGISDGSMGLDTRSVTWNDTVCTSCNSTGTCVFLGLPAAANGPSIEWKLDPTVPCGGIDLLLSISVDVDADRRRDAACGLCCALWDPDGDKGTKAVTQTPAEPTGGQFLSVEVTGLDGAGQPFADVHQGLVVAWSNETFDRAGLFADPGLTEGGNGTGGRQLTGSVAPVATIPASSTEVTLTVRRFRHAEADGDLDGSGAISWDDHALFATGLGTGLGTLGFDPRGDFDADLDLDDADRLAIQALPCISDLNGDRVLDNGDISAYVALFNAGDPAAEADGVPGLSFFDVTRYNEIWTADTCSP